MWICVKFSVSRHVKHIQEPTESALLHLGGLAGAEREEAIAAQLGGGRLRQNLENEHTQTNMRKRPAGGNTGVLLGWPRRSAIINQSINQILFAAHLTTAKFKTSV